MAYKVIRNKVVRDTPPSVSNAPSVLQVNQVSTAVGAKVDFLSWQKNATEIWNDPSNTPRATYVNFATDTLKLLGAAKDAGLKVPGLGSVVTSLSEAMNKLAKIAGDINVGKGAQINDLMSVVSEGLAVASEIPGLKLTPVGVGMKIVGIGLSAVSLVVPDEYRIPIPGFEPTVPIQSRYTTVGADVYRDGTGDVSIMVVTLRDTQTNQLIRNQMDASGKLVLSVRELGGNQFEVSSSGGSAPAASTFNPLSPENLKQNFGDPAKGSLLNPTGSAGKLSDAMEFVIDELITADLSRSFGDADPLDH